MTAWRTRVILAVVVVASLLVRLEGLRDHGEPAVAVKMVEKIKTVLIEHGVAPLETSFDSSDVVYFQRPNCDRASWVTPYGLASDELIYLQKAIKPGFEARYLFLDKSWDAPDRLALYYRWARNLLLAGLGASRYTTQKTAILLVEPQGCDKTAPMDWSRLWRRDASTSAGSERVGDRAEARGAE